jgi:hypothetical protein
MLFTNFENRLKSKKNSSFRNLFANISKTSLLFFLLECCKKKEKNKQFSKEKKGIKRKEAQPILSDP